MQGAVGLLNVLTIPPGAGLGQRIVIDGVRGAMFEYNASNQLVSSWASKAGTDPFGNTYPAGFNIGPGSSFSGTDFDINSTGIFFYSSAPALGNLIASVAPSSGTDSFGNVYVEGVAAYEHITTGSFPGTYVIYLGDQTFPFGGTFASLTFQNQTHPGFQPSGITTQVHATAGAVLGLNSGSGPNTATESEILMYDTVAGPNAGAFPNFWGSSNLSLINLAASIITIPGPTKALYLAGSPLALGPITDPAAIAGISQIFQDTTTGNLFSNSAADGGNYNMEYGIKVAGGAQTISSTTGAVISGLSGVVTSGKSYSWVVFLIYHGGQAAGAASFSMTETGGSILTPWIGGLFMSGATTGTGAQTGAAGPVNSPTLSTATWISILFGRFTVSAPGTFNIHGAATINGDSFTIDQGYMVLFTF